MVLTLYKANNGQANKVSAINISIECCEEDTASGSFGERSH